MSTINDIFVLHGLISHILNQGQKLYCAFVDFTKAFEYVVRENLWYKLVKIGLRGKSLTLSSQCIQQLNQWLNIAIN